MSVEPASADSIFKNVAERLLSIQRDDIVSNDEWYDFWSLARNLDPDSAATIIQKQQADIPELLLRIRLILGRLRVRTIDGNWRPFAGTILPGAVVPEDGSRDADIAIDIAFHKPDLPLLKQLGAVDEPCSKKELSLFWDRYFPLGVDRFIGRFRILTDQYRFRFIRECREKFIQHINQLDLPSSPRWEKLNFELTTTSGPLGVLSELSEEGSVLYTYRLLSLEDTYQTWTMRHDTQGKYGSMECESPAIYVLREFGRIEVDGEIHKLSDGLGDPPKSPAVLRKLLSHPQHASIYRAFGISAEIDASVAPYGEDDPIPLTDEWPGLRPHLSDRQTDLELVRCNGLRSLGSEQGEFERECAVKKDIVYVTRREDGRKELQAVLRALGVHLEPEQIKSIFHGKTNEDIQAKRDEIRKLATEAERLLKAVGESDLRRLLPSMLIEILEADNGGPLSGVQIAQAAIATFHTGALREYRDALRHLDPPKKWAGTPAAVAFVQSLGFGEEWAMERNARRDPYIEVEGPYSLPSLHAYQRTIVDKVRSLIQSDGTLEDRRGMISLPTGSGKTRVAVQAMVEALREEKFAGGILWVADRDELCEQAVEAWRQVWASEGRQSAQLRISRMWEGQPSPLPTGDMHVIVASIQTLSPRIRTQPAAYEFLADFKLVVFDEAHRSVAPTFTAVMEELGLTRWRRVDEPFLIGLTATPYRGYDEDETQRLVNRYGSNRLDAGAFNSDQPEAVIEELQDMRVLARADQATIEGGNFSLSANELRQARDLPWLPESVEQRIAEDADRTRRIMQAYIDRIEPHWPTLIFATSVDHAQVLSALLDSNGISSRAVSSKTDRIVRRRVVEEFRNGKLQALVNYNVFREGFDAPRTRAIIVARPVYSPNLYFQMIGRGLRGKLNGGNDRCLILNVEDNIENFEGKLAFSELNWLWDRG